MSETKVPGIYKKLHAIMAACPYIQKDKSNEHFKYRYASEAAIKEKLHELFVENKVIAIPSAVQQEVVEIGKSSRGDARFRTVLAFNYRFIDIEDGSFVDASMPGAGVDGEDKGTYKAITGALKYCLTGTFIIPTGDDPENEDGARQEKKQEATHKGKESTTIGKPAEAHHPSESAPAMELADILADINVDVLGDPELSFVNETRSRLKQYGAKIRISDKQIRWLKAIRETCLEANEGRSISGPDDYTA